MNKKLSPTAGATPLPRWHRWNQALVSALVVGLVSISGQVAHASPVVTGDTITIGQSAPLTGSNAEFGQDIRNGALALFGKINDAGGINGRRIKLITLDDANEKERAGRNTEALLREHGAFALFGYGSATLSAPALPIVTKEKVPFLGAITGADTMRAHHPYVFNFRASYADELNSFLAIYLSGTMTKLAVVHYDDQVGRENFETVKRSLAAKGVTTVSSIPVTRNQENVGEAADKIVQTAPSGVIVTILPTPAASIVRAVRSNGRSYQPHFAAISFTAATPLSRKLDEHFRGVAVSMVVPLTTDGERSVVGEYRRALAKALPDAKPSLTGLEAFISAKAVVEAMKRTGRDLTRERFVASLESMTHFDAGGYVLSFSPKNHNGSNFVSLARIMGPDRFTN